MEQAMQALAIANECRSQTAAWKREVKALPRQEAIRTIIAALEVKDPRAGMLTPSQLIRLVPRVGEGKAEILLTAIDAPAARKVRDLKNWQLQRLLGAFVYLGQSAAVRARMRNRGRCLPTLYPPR